MPGGHGYIYQLNCSRGGVPKLPVEEAQLTPTGLSGDRQRYPMIHGGPQRALCLYSLEMIQALQAEGHPIYPGSTGENVTVVGLDWAQLAPGCRLALGDEVIIELTSYANPCRNIKGSFGDGKFKRISQKEHAGESRLYARVISTGRLAVGQQVRVLDGAAGEER
ncbi:MAG TPA: MOSC domain-containing protein [Pyrinomonadaceae bacterium]|nr:MOSC domain-containing protein [Pyrinomonadaceae bacterium]